jgi:SHS2 domain-containing protein
VTNEQVEPGGQVGHRDLPHTADVRIEAWAPSLEACLEQAVAGLVETFADLSAVGVAGEVTFELADAPADDLLVAVLDEVIYRLDTESVLPVQSDVQRTGPGWSVRFEVAPAAEAELIGAVPKATSLHGLMVERSASGWRCEVTVDI